MTLFVMWLTNLHIMVDIDAVLAELNAYYSVVR